ncbi:MAG: hypothetical protein JWM11_7934, partial [Planctomycetaceae bacterium]|nr:hypothetical protein [Planctomycetaceae bacterium]
RAIAGGGLLLQPGKTHRPAERRAAGNFLEADREKVRKKADSRAAESIQSSDSATTAVSACSEWPPGARIRCGLHP